MSPVAAATPAPVLAARTYGTVTYEGPDGDGRWVITCEPHVSIRLKRIFGRVNVHRTGRITIADTAEVAFELAWVLDRWPMVLDDRSAGVLATRAATYAEREETVAAILAGYERPGDRLEVARPLRGYQRTAADLVLATGRLLLCDDVGTGKTTSALGVLTDPDALPALVVTLTHLPHQWLAELGEVLPQLSGHVIRSGTPYDPTTKRGVDRQPDVWISNYHKLAGWAETLAGQVRTVIFDEAHELRRGESAKYQAAAQIAHAATYRMGATATPVFNYGVDMYNVIDVLDPGALGERAEFNREWCVGDGNRMRVADPAAFGAYLREQGLMLRRRRTDPEIARELPEVTRVEHHVDVDSDAVATLAADAVGFAHTLLDDTAKPTERWHAAGEFDMRMRQATGIAKAPYVAELVRLLIEAGEPVVLFGWHLDVYDLWAERLADLRPAFYTGRESANAKHRSAADFLEGRTDLLIMSLRAGAGLDGLQARSNVCVFGELDWSPAVHDQAIGRLHRDGQDNPVVAYFVVSDTGADPTMAEVLNVKRNQAEPISDPDRSLFVPTTDTSDRLRRVAEEFLASRR